MSTETYDRGRSPNNENIMYSKSCISLFYGNTNCKHSSS